MLFIQRILAHCNASRLWLGDCLALMAGMLMPLGFAPLAWRVVPIISLSLLFLLLQDQSPKRAAGRGFLFGFGMFGLGVSWVYNSLHDFGSASVWVATLIAVALILIMACYVGLSAYVYRRWFPVKPVPGLLLVMPAIWVLVEWLRGWLFTGFPWLLIGYSQVDTWLAGYAPIGGVLLVSLVSSVIAGALCLLLLGCNARQRLLAVAMICLLLFVGILLQGITWTQPAGKSISIALVQGAIPQHIKMQPRYLDISLQRYIELTEPYLDRDLIIWPETAIHAFSFTVEPFLRKLENDLRAHDSELLTGIFVHDFDADRYYNSLMTIGYGNRAVYRKQRLVPFGEYMPLRSLLEFARYYVNIPMSDIAAAKLPGRVNLVGYPVALGICYESAYPQVYREQLPDSVFMVNVSNDAWFGDSLAPHQHLEIARMRALEAARFMLRATNSGISAVIDSNGLVVARSSQFEEAVVLSEIEPLKGETLFIRFGNWLVLIVCIVSMGAAILISGKPNAN
ncbi:MAG: apolipoprotein N-acyltransferase [Gammaproteobacteria bacterium]|nr:apolipoprotein N-acyltransferase [Gammaproteobacteria bacterium]